MIITLEAGADARALLAAVSRLVEQYQAVTARLHQFEGASEAVAEVHLIGDTRSIPEATFAGIVGVRSVVRVSQKYRLIGRPPQSTQPAGFEYNGVRLDDRTLNIFAGLCAVDTREHAAEMFRALRAQGLTTTRMGAYKPRTSPYDFQGLGRACLPWLFELAGEHGIRIIALEVCDVRQVDEVRDALAAAGNPTGVMLQVGTRNAQNFELLKQLGQQREFPVLFKRGMGITIEEALNACEYIASEGNPRIVFCLRGVRSHLGEPHRNLVDFALVPVVRRLTRLPVCIDPSHSVGSLHAGPEGLPEIFHVSGQGLVVGATMVLVEFHPHPALARCDAHQALSLDQLPRLLAYARRMRAAYEAVIDDGLA
jgi:3-deoxy-7-phosphoheptulonate synthase